MPNLTTFKTPDKVIDFLNDGYLFAGKLRRRAGLSPDSETPITVSMLGKKTTILRGEEGVRAFYDSAQFVRKNAMPSFVSGPLFGKGAIHGLDGEAHRVRKEQMIAQAYDDSRVAEIKPLLAEEVEKMLQEWETNEGNVYDDAARAFGRAAFRWAGLPMDEDEMNKRAAQYSRLLDTFGRPVTNPVAWVERKRLDSWAEGVIEQIRAGIMEVPEGSVAANVAGFVDENGELLDAKTAGIELQNLTRPTVAVSRFAAFAAAALVENQAWIERIRSAAGGQLIDVPEAVAFAQEVRRTKPFVPMLPAIAKDDTEVSGCPIHKGQRVLIDILNTNTGPKSWHAAGTFDPERFLGVDDYESIVGFLPQGGMDVKTGHRCPGEKIAIAALSITVAALCQPEIKIADDQEDLTFDWKRILTRPETGVRVKVQR
ncbi:cytochrome P450 [Corynebacterium incognita]|uniref:Cytochrome P450 n=1 Tax=Corynebacterium incognita TaxID=2754725 RepID=A0A7G7CM17_9CORY|nr:cytochrome P450 [Corynebacterium incognita]QNE88633.1 cytochrome P450 [Corynebacterium incognita]